MVVAQVFVVSVKLGLKTKLAGKSIFRYPFFGTTLSSEKENRYAVFSAKLSGLSMLKFLSAESRPVVAV